MTFGMIELHDRTLRILRDYGVEDAEEIAAVLVGELEDDGFEVNLPDEEDDDYY